MKYFKENGYGISLLCLNKWGPLLEEFESICTVDEIPQHSRRRLGLFQKKSSKDDIKFIRSKYIGHSFDLIYANTIASAKGALLLKSALKVPLISHIHELQFSLELYAEKEDREELFANTDHVIACSQAVKENLLINYPLLSEKSSVIHSFVANKEILKILDSSNANAIKEEFQLPTDAFLVGACGNAEWRKGLDVFINLANTALQIRPESNVHFVWIGLKNEGEYYEQIMYDVKKMNIGSKISFLAPTPKAIEIINALDIFTVSSREDPFPLVMLEAALCEKAILGFENTGGCSEFVQNEAGLLTDYLNINGMALNLFKLQDEPKLSIAKGKKGRRLILEKYNFKNSVEKIKSRINLMLA